MCQVGKREIENIFIVYEGEWKRSGSEEVDRTGEEVDVEGGDIGGDSEEAK